MNQGATPIVVAAAVCSAAVIGAAAWFALHNPGGATTDPQTAHRAFNLRVHRVFTKTVGGISDADGTAQEAATQIQATLSDLYAAGFQTQTSWRAGTYDAAWQVFTSDARSAARNDAAVLTLGPDAADRFVNVSTGRGNMEIQVLVDDDGDAKTAIADVYFSVPVEMKDHSVMKMESTGTYYLRSEGGRWAIYAYDVDRDEKAQKG